MNSNTCLTSLLLLLSTPILITGCSGEGGGDGTSTGVSTESTTSGDSTTGAGSGSGGQSSDTTGSGGNTTASSSGGMATGSGGAAGGGANSETGGDSSAGGTGNMSSSGGASPSTGGSPASGGTDGGGGEPGPGEISIFDPVPGYASVAEGTTGGGTDLSQAITVSTMSELKSAAGSADPRIVLVEPGNYEGSLSVAANTTIMGLGPGAKIKGNLSISGSEKFNIIIRNIAVQGNHCATYDECKDGSDAVYIGKGAHHVWLDHMDISDGQDGNCDVTRGGDYITISWSNFYYTYDKEHRFSNLIAGSDDEPESVGKLKITYMNNHWGDRVDQRQPRGRFGNIHMLNNYHKTGGSQIHGVGKDMALIAENCVYEENRSIWKDMGSPRGWKGMGNIGSGSDLNASMGTVFEIPYEYEALPADQVKTALLSDECGAGNSCTLHQ